MSKVTKVTFVGSNYEGVTMRGYGNQTDNRYFQIDLVGTEAEICAFIMHNCNEGPDELEELTLECLVNKLKAEELVQFDGCGGILKLVESGTVLFDDMNQFSEVLADEKILDLGELKLAETKPNNYDLINEMIHELFDNHPEQFTLRKF